MKKLILSLSVFLFTIMLICSPVNAYHSSFLKQNKQHCQVKVENYTLACGIYKGYETVYNNDTQKTMKKEVIAILGKNTITINSITSKFKIKNNKLYVNGYEMYEVIGNNKFHLLAGGGIYFNHE